MSGYRRSMDELRPPRCRSRRKFSLRTSRGGRHRWHGDPLSVDYFPPSRRSAEHHAVVTARVEASALARRWLRDGREDVLDGRHASSVAASPPIEAASIASTLSSRRW